MSKHTPGPWRADQDCVIWAGGKRVSTAVHTSGFSSIDEIEANARLISLCPEMLAMLKRCAPMLSGWHELKYEVEALISRAEGKT